MAVTATAVKDLREKTGAGMMDCKAALEATNGDFELAIDWLRKKGISNAAKKAGRTASDGVVSVKLYENGARGVIVEINCETDFVAKTEDFQSLIQLTSDTIANLTEVPTSAEKLPIEIEEKRAATVGKLGENMLIKRFARIDLKGFGKLQTYTHPGGKLAVLVEFNANSHETVNKTEFQELCNDIALQIAASGPIAVNRESVSQEIINHELEIAREQARATGKPEAIVDKIALGKMDKIYSELCLLEQEFVKDTSLKVSEYIEKIGKQLGDPVRISSFLRYKLGE